MVEKLLSSKRLRSRMLAREEHGRTESPMNPMNPMNRDNLSDPWPSLNVTAEGIKS